MEKQDFEFPAVIKEAIRGLNNTVRWKILESIITNGSMSYTKLMKELKIENKGILTFHLEALSKSTLIERYEDLSIRTRDRSFYEISPIGKDIINGLMSAMAPQTNLVEFNKSLFETAATAFDRSIKYYYATLANEGSSIPLQTPIAA
jgi:DNA-binding HxlR family transcriptional regulator